MSFIYENIPSDDVERVAEISDELKWWMSPTSWVVDRERDAFLICVSVGTKPDFGPPGEYALVWRGEIVRIEAYVRETGTYPNDLICIYDVMHTFIPEHLVGCQEEILALRNQALDAKGRSYPIAVKQVVVNEMFPARQ